MSGKLIQDKIWGYHSGNYYDYSLVGCNMWIRWQWWEQVALKHH